MDGRRTGIRLNVLGPAGEAGFLLVVPPSEELDWDVQHEIGSTSRYWMSDRQAWWIAAPYLATAREILSRFEPRREPAWLRLAWPHLPRQVRSWLAGILGAAGSLRGSADRV